MKGNRGRRVMKGIEEGTKGKGRERRKKGGRMANTRRR